MVSKQDCVRWVTLFSSTTLKQFTSAVVFSHALDSVSASLFALFTDKIVALYLWFLCKTLSYVLVKRNAVFFTLRKDVELAGNFLILRQKWMCCVCGLYFYTRFWFLPINTNTSPNINKLWRRVLWQSLYSVKFDCDNCRYNHSQRRIN